MAGRLNGKTCLVTGAAQGMGRAIAEAFLREGAAVIASDISAARLAPFTAHPLLARIGLDVLDEKQIVAAAAAHGAVDVLVNCAGFVAGGTILDDGVARLRHSIEINVVSMTAMIAAFLPAMIARGGGAIVNIASVAGTIMAVPDRFAYGASKAAVLGLTKSVALDFIGRGIRCNAICPGTVDTPSLRERLAAQPDPAAAERAFIARQPMGRFGAASEIAEVAVLLASDEARFMTGQCIAVDGGMSL